MARDAYLDQRLINWARWLAGGRCGTLGMAGVNWAAFDGGDRYGSTSSPVLPDGEEAVTDAAVRALPQDMQRVLVVQYVEGGTVERKAAKLGCHTRTFHDKVNAACVGVGLWLADHNRRAQAERERVEALQRRR